MPSPTVADDETFVDAFDERIALAVATAYQGSLKGSPSSFSRSFSASISPSGSRRW